MGIIKKQSIQNTFIAYIGIILGAGTTLYLYPNILTPDQYGLTRLLLSLAFICTEFTHLGIKNISIRFFPYFEDKNKGHNGFLFIILTVPLMGFMGLLAILFSFDDLFISYYSEDSSLFANYYFYLIPLIFGILYFDVLNSFIRARYDSVPGSIINEVVLRIISIGLLALYFWGFLDFKMFMIGFVASYLLEPIILVFYLIKVGEFSLKPDFNFLNQSLLKRIGNYGLFVMLGGVTHLIVSNIDIIMLASLSGLTDTAIYAIAFYIGSVIIVPQKSIGKIAPSLLSKHLAEDNLNEVERIYKSTSMNQFIPGCLIFIGIWANLENLVEILPEEYASAGLVIIIIGISKLIDMAAGVNGNIIINSKYYKFNLVATILLVLISITLNYFLIPLYGIVGAAIATAVSLLIYNLIKGAYVWVKFSMQPLSPKIVLVILLGALILWGSTQVPRMGNLYSDIIIRSISIAILFSSGIIYLNISDEINKTWEDLKTKVPIFKR